MTGLNDILGMIGTLGGMSGAAAGSDPLAALSLLSGLTQMGGGGIDPGGPAGPDGDDLAQQGAEDAPIDVKNTAPIGADPCADCPIQCDRARLTLPSYDQVCAMAKDWQRY